MQLVDGSINVAVPSDSSRNVKSSLPSTYIRKAWSEKTHAKAVLSLSIGDPSRGLQHPQSCVSSVLQKSAASNQPCLRHKLAHNQAMTSCGPRRGSWQPGKQLLEALSLCMSAFHVSRGGRQQLQSSEHDHTRHLNDQWQPDGRGRTCTVHGEALQAAATSEKLHPRPPLWTSPGSCAKNRTGPTLHNLRLHSHPLVPAHSPRPHIALTTPPGMLLPHGSLPAPCNRSRTGPSTSAPQYCASSPPAVVTMLVSMQVTSLSPVRILKQPCLRPCAFGKLHTPGKSGATTTPWQVSMSTHFDSPIGASVCCTVQSRKKASQ